MGKLRAKFVEWGSIDIRALAFFRIGLGATLLWDLLYRLQDLKAFYTDWGVTPRDLAMSTLLEKWMVSLHLLSGQWQVQLVLFLIAIFFATLLLIGYKTRLAAIVSWILLISLQTRNPLVLQGGDIVLRVLLFWGIFLPLGAFWSLDQKIKPTAMPKQVHSVATWGLLLQVCFIYWFTALLKTDPSWRSEGSAIWYALNIEQFTKPLGFYLLQFPEALKILTLFTFYLEAFGPFFAFSPFWTPQLRFGAALTFMLFHLIGLNLTMELGHFSYICAVGWIVFLPTWFWDKVWKRREFSPLPWRQSRLASSLALFFVAYIFLWNVATLETHYPVLPERLDCVGQVTRVDQCWNMFSPFPLKEDGWFVIPANLRDGTVVDLFTDGGEVTFDKPEIPIVDTYQSDRWRSYMMNLVFEPNREDQLLGYGRYLTRKWNESHPYERQALNFDIYFMLKRTEATGTTPPERLLLWEHDCETRE